LHAAPPAQLQHRRNGNGNDYGDGDGTVSYEEQHELYDTAASLSMEDEAVICARAIGAMKGISRVLTMYELGSLAVL
jgi:hypothetical protein